MRGNDERRDGLFSYVRSESRIPSNHPLRLIRRFADAALKALDAQFAALYSENGRPSIPPEQLLRALLLQAFYTIRSERQLMEQLNYNLLFRWFVGLSVDDPVWVPTVFSKNRDRLLEGDIAAAFMDAVLNLPRVKLLLSDEHFSVDGTLIQAWASMKSFRRKDGNDEPPARGRNGERNFHKEKRSNETHASTTDPDARLARKSSGEGAKLAFTGHLLMENRNGLVVDACLTHATGTAEPEAALAMLRALPDGSHKTVGADKAYDTAAFVASSRAAGVTPHVAQNITAHRGSNIGVLLGGSLAGALLIGRHVPPYVRRYIVGLLFAANIVGARVALQRTSGVLEAIRRPVRWLAGATFTLYLFHLPIAQFIRSIDLLPGASWENRCLVIGGTFAVVLALSMVTERQKRVWQAWFRRGLAVVSASPSVQVSDSGQMSLRDMP